MSRRARSRRETNKPRFGPAPNIDPRSAPLGIADKSFLPTVEPTLRAGLELKSWWYRKTGPWAQHLLDPDKLRRILGSGLHPKMFPLLKPELYEDVNLGYGFFDVAPIGNRPVPIYGFVQQVFFDHAISMLHQDDHDKHNPKQLAAINHHHQQSFRRWRDGLREFVWKYFLRCTDVDRIHTPYPQHTERPLDDYLKPFSWFFDGKESSGHGVVNRRLYYRYRSDGRIGKFREVDQRQIDLREVGTGGPYLWTVISMASLSTPKIRLEWPPVQTTIPLRYGVLSEGFLSQHEHDPDEGGSGCYTFGLALANNPTSGLRPGFVQFQFHTQATGRITVRIILLRARPEHFTSELMFFPKSALPHPLADLDPLKMFIQISNGLTGGWTGKNLGYSLEQVQKRILTSGALELLNILDSMLYIWRSVPDWTDEDAIPSWIKT